MRTEDQIILEDLYCGIHKKGKCLECGKTLNEEDFKIRKELLLKEEDEISQQVDPQLQKPDQALLAKQARANCNGVIVYHGMNNGENIVAIATGLINPSDNRKTGPMVQIWILVADIHPEEAIKQGRDQAICGDCIHRKAKGGACYVETDKAPSQIWKSFKKGNYPYIVDDASVLSGGNATAAYVQHGDWSIFRNRFVRFGAYGDPSFIPVEIMEKIAQNAKGFTGYTHQWKNTNKAYQKYLMASVDFPWEYKIAKQLGWKTFRVTTEWENKASNEVPCLNSSMGRQCIDCLLCSGTTKPGKDIYIKVHGKNVKRFIEIFGTKDDDSDQFNHELTASDVRQIGMAKKREEEAAKIKEYEKQLRKQQRLAAGGESKPKTKASKKFGNTNTLPAPK
jgi:hypothetical protein